MSNDDRSESVPADEQPELPPAFAKFVAQLKADRKALMREKAYGESATQLRAFMGQYLFARMTEMVELMGLALYDTYGLAVSNANQMQRMRAVYGKALKKLGEDVGNEAELPGVSTEVLDELQQAFYALGTLLGVKLPEDKETQDAFNRCAELMGEMVAELIGEGGRGEDEDEDDDDDDDEDEEDDEDEDEPAEGEVVEEEKPEPKS